MSQLWRRFYILNLQKAMRKNPRQIFVNNKTNFSGGQRQSLTVGIDFPMYEVSTTRGTPSTSTDLKEALCEKIPVHYDLLRNFRLQHGSSVINQITVENIYQRLSGVNTIVRETSEIDPKHGIRYRGLTLPEVITLLSHKGKAPNAESVFWLLLTGDVPTEEQTSSLIADWSARRQKRKEWWSGPGGGIVGSVLQTLPNTITPLGRLSIALTALDASKHMKEATNNGAMSHTYWEYTFEDSMELLATLPAIVGLVAKNQELKNVKEDCDWIQFLLECLSEVSEDLKNRKTSVENFLRLYVTLNADEDGGVPGAHVTEIVGAAQLDINQALAAGILAYADEPKTGTLFKCMQFQSKLQNILGREPKKESLKNCIANLIEKDKLIGYRESEFYDPRYLAVSNYAKDHLSDDCNVKFSQLLTRILIAMMKTTKGRSISPEPNTLAAPIFEFYGLKDMKFNQTLFCMSRALGAVASIIWTRAINAPVENPRSKCTYSYMNSLQDTRKRYSRVKYVKKFRK